MRRLWCLTIGIVLAWCLSCAPAWAEAGPDAQDCVSATCVRLGPAQLFDLAERFAHAGRVEDAKLVLRKLAENRDASVRAEAYYRLGNLLGSSGDLTGAASAYRTLLGENPRATPVRLELARVLMDMGEEDAARGQLRRASSAGLPPEVARVVDRFQLALRSRRRLGGSIQIALAPDTNINSATNQEVVDVGSVPIALSKDAQARSGVGLALPVSGFWRPALDANTNMLITVNGNADLYRASRFNDISLSVAAGPELLRGRARYRLSAVAGRRWFGGRRYSASYGGTANWLRQIDRVSQVQVDFTVLRTDYRLNPAMDGPGISAVLRYERALSPRLFGRVMVRIDRQGARDPAFRTTSPGVELLLSRDFGAQTLFGRVGYTRTAGDAPFTLPPARRRDDTTDLEAGLILHRLAYRGFAPVLDVRRTVNRSPVFFYDFRRTRVEVGFSKEF